MEMADVFDAVLHHDETVNAPTPCEACVDGWIDAGRAENVRMDHATAKQLDPALIATDIAALFFAKRT